jgi:hypothetical protein
MSRRGYLCAVVAMALLTACAVGPNYKRPKFDTSASYKEENGWKPSEPNDVLSRGPWWEIFNDTTLNELEEKDRHLEREREGGCGGLRPSQCAGGSGARGLLADRGWERVSGCGARVAASAGSPPVRPRSRRAAAKPSPPAASPRVIPAVKPLRPTASESPPIGPSISGAKSAAPSRATKPRRNRAPRPSPVRACPPKARSPPIISNCALKTNCRSCWTTPSSPSSFLSKSPRAAIASALPPKPMS